MYLAYGVNSALLGGGGIPEPTAKAEESAALARQSGMPTAIVQSLNSLALTVVEHDPARLLELRRRIIAPRHRRRERWDDWDDGLEPQGYWPEES